MEHASVASHATSGHDAHAHGSQAHGSHSHGSHSHGGDLPPVPSERHITPAPADYARLPGAAALLFPIVWCVIAGLLITRALGSGWSLHHIEPHAEHAQPGH